MDTRSIDYHIVAVCAAVIMANVLSTFNPVFGLMLGIGAFVAVLFAYLSKGHERAFVVFLILCSASLEAKNYVFGLNSDSVLYGFLRMPSVGSLAAIILFGIGFIVFKTEHRVGQKDMKDHPFLRLANASINFLFLSGAIFFSLSILSNDNGMADLMSEGWFALTVVRESIKILFPLMILKYVIQLFMSNRFALAKLEELITEFLIGMSIVVVLSACLNITGYYNTLELPSTIAPLVHIFTSALILIGLFRSGIDRIVCIIAGIAGLIVILFITPSPLSGTWVIMQCALLMVAVFVLTKTKYIPVLVCLMFVGIISLFISAGKINITDLTEFKFKEVINLFENGFDINDADSKSHTVTVRIDEIANVFMEFNEKPWYYLFGKGFGGTMEQHTNLNWSLPGDFSEEQVSSGVFVTSHTSVCLMFLKFGLVGLFFLLVLMCISLRNIRKTPWLFIGVYWLIFYIGTFPTLAPLGISALVIGLFQVEKIKYPDSLFNDGQKRITNMGE